MKDSNIINDGIRVKKGDVTVGTHIERLIINLYRDSSPLQLDDKELRELRDAYLGYLRQQCQTLDFKGIRLPEAVEKTAGLSLRDVYVPVRARLELPEGETWQRIAGRYWKGDAVSGQAVPDRFRPAAAISIEDMINNYPALVILGDPGAGKSTLLKYLALNLATTEARVLPILAPLNAYSKALQENASLNLSDFLPRYFAGRQHQLKSLGALFQAALNQGKAIVLLDGLDEVVAERGRVVALVDDFVREYLPEPEQPANHLRKAIVSSLLAVLSVIGKRHYEIHAGVRLRWWIGKKRKSNVSSNALPWRWKRWWPEERTKTSIGRLKGRNRVC